MERARLLTQITQPGQSFYDRPVIARLRPLVAHVRQALDGCPRQPRLLGYQRVRLNWVEAPRR